MSSLSFRHSPSHKYKKIGEKEADVSMLQAAQGVKASLRALASIFFQFFCFGLVQWTSQKRGGCAHSLTTRSNYRYLPNLPG